MKLFGALLLLSPALAAAETSQPISAPGEAPEYGFVGETRADGMVMARQVLPATRAIDAGMLGDVSTPVLAQSKIIYLAHNGVTLRPGDNDSRQGLSTIVQQQTTFAAWSASATTWNDTVTCFRDLFSRFDVQVVDTDPGNVPHMLAVFGGSPTQVGMPTNVLGVSPFTTDCSIIENSVVFTFTQGNNLSSRQACEIMAQEVAHSYGLDHELLASDPMTYLNYNMNRAFQDQTVSCGESTARVCGINGSQCRQNQNSVTLLRDRLGTADAVAPTMSWTTPPNNSTVPPGFEVKATGADNIAVAAATLKIDGAQVDMVAGPGPYTFVTSATLTEGPHTLIVEISDGHNLKSETRNVTVKKGAPPPGEGTGSGSGDDPLDNGDIVGGCASGGGNTGALLAFGLVGLLALRRRR